jgi:hypothetical protein
VQASSSLEAGEILVKLPSLYIALAFQLSKVSSDLKRYVCEAVNKRPDIGEQNLRDQMGAAYHSTALGPIPFDRC